MTDARNSREDVIAAAGRLFAERGYHATSMRDLGRELGLLGSSLYSHIGSKEELLIEVIRRGERLFQEAAERASEAGGTAADRLAALIAGHIAVVLDHREEVRTFLNEADALSPSDRRQVIEARNRYEQVFRTVLKDGATDGSLPRKTDPRLGAIFLLSILNSIERWYSPDGPLDRRRLAEEVLHYAM